MDTLGPRLHERARQARGSFAPRALLAANPIRYAIRLTRSSVNGLDHTSATVQAQSFDTQSLRGDRKSGRGWQFVVSILSTNSSTLLELIRQLRSFATTRIIEPLYPTLKLNTRQWHGVHQPNRGYLLDEETW